MTNDSRALSGNTASQLNLQSVYPQVSHMCSAARLARIPEGRGLPLCACGMRQMVHSSHVIKVAFSLLKCKDDKMSSLSECSFNNKHFCSPLDVITQKMNNVICKWTCHNP